MPVIHSEHSGQWKLYSSNSASQIKQTCRSLQCRQVYNQSQTI